MSDVDDLANEIRRVDGSHDLGAGALAEALLPWLASKQAEAWSRGYVDRLGDAPRYDAPSQWPNPYREDITA